MHFDTSPNLSKFRKFGIGAPGPQSAPRGNETATFAKGFFLLFNLPKFLLQLNADFEIYGQSIGVWNKVCKCMS